MLRKDESSYRPRLSVRLVLLIMFVAVTSLLFGVPRGLVHSLILLASACLLITLIFSVASNGSVKSSLVVFSTLVLSLVVANAALPLNFRSPKNMILWDPNEKFPERRLEMAVSQDEDNWRNSGQALDRKSRAECTAIIGDSFAFGIVDDRDTLAEVLLSEKKYKCVSNYGVPGMGLRYYRYMMKNIPERHVILTVYLGNDLIFDRLITLDLLDSLYSAPLLRLIGHMYDSIISGLESGDPSVHLARRVNPALPEYLMGLERNTTIAKNNIQRVNIFTELGLDKTDKMVEVIIVPSKFQFTEFYKSYYSKFMGLENIFSIQRGVFDELLLQCESLGLKCSYSKNKIFESEEIGRHVFYTLDDHPNAYGTRLIVEHHLLVNK